MFAHSHAQPLCIKKFKKYLAHSTIYKNPDSNPMQTITNDVLSTLDFLCSNHQVVHRGRNYLTAQRFSLFHGLLKITSPYQNLYILNFFYGLPKIHISYLHLHHLSFTNQFSNYVINFMQPFEEVYSHHTSAASTFPIPRPTNTINMSQSHEPFCKLF